MIKLAIFDLDGTLYDYKSCNEVAENKLFNTLEERFGVSKKNAESLLCNAKKRVHGRLGDVASAHNRMLYMQMMCEEMSVNPCEHVLFLYNTYWDALLENMRAYDYVIPLFSRLIDGNIKIAVLTDLTAHIQYRKIEQLGIGKYLDYIVTSEEVGHDKPAREMFELVLSKAGVEPNEAIMIGDDLTKDIMGALALGLHTFSFENNSCIMRDIIEVIKNGDNYKR